MTTQDYIKVTVIADSGEIQIVEITDADMTEWFVYGITMSGDPIVCPSIGMAYEKAGI